jgi:hypothetical protein
VDITLPVLSFSDNFQWEKERKEEKRKREEAARDLGEIESRYAVVGLCKDQTRRRGWRMVGGVEVVQTEGTGESGSREEGAVVAWVGYLGTMYR